MPFKTMGPSHCARNQSRSRQDSAGSNWELVYSARFTGRSSAGALLPLTFEKVIGSARAKAHVQPGCSSPSIRVPGPSCGGMVKPRRTSRSRRPSTAVSTVMAMAS
jgi:hypothetical protein